MRKKRLILNTIASLSDQIATVICGIILPRFFLLFFGSEVNGLVSSLTQFLSFISFLDLGVGAVVQSALYAPLAKNDEDQISRIMISSRRFFNTIATILAFYVVALIFIYPLKIRQFDFFYICALILAISIKQFAQYYFGVVNQQLLSAHQRAYISLSLHAVSIVLNTAVSIVIIKLGGSIQLVTLVSSLVFLLQPLGMWLYVRRNYRINYRLKLCGEPIKQKWNGLAQHVASVVLDSTDTIVLTLFSTLKNVSVYSVYYFVVSGIRQVLDRFSTGMQALLGDLYARNETDKLRDMSEKFEFTIHMGVTFLFGCTGILLVPFITVYTAGVRDANYNAPLFGLLLTLSQAIYCLRIPYNMLVKAAGHYRQTQASAIIETTLNLVLSVVCVVRFGLIGVAIGTLVAMIYRTTYLAWYSKKYILGISIFSYVRHILTDAISMALMFVVCSVFKTACANYRDWILLALKVSLTCGAVCAATNSVFYYQKMRVVLSHIGGPRSR